jgi:hypothetical protein
MINCAQCAQAAGGFAVFHVEAIREDGLYTGKCPRGHDLLVATQTLRHEMLFEIALNAIVDGYRREAISSFASSVERFFEFALRVLARNRQVAPEVADRREEELACDVWAREFVTVTAAAYAASKGSTYAEVLQRRSMSFVLAALILHEITPIWGHGGNGDYFPVAVRMENHPEKHAAAF